jgi:low temperature requirement protein LtrA
MEEALDAVDPDDLGGAARDAYSLGHFPLIGGIIGFAVAVEEVVAHPDAPMADPVVASLLVGIGLFVGASCFACWRLTGRLLAIRVVLLAVTLAVTLLASGADPVWPLAAVALGLLAIVVTEERTERPRSAALSLD